MAELDQKELRLLILRDGKPGHETKPDGFVRYLRQQADVQVAEANIRLPLAALMRPLLTLVINHLPTLLWRRAVLFLYGLSLDDFEPDLVLAAGGKSSFALAACQATENVTGVLLGSARRLRPDRLGWVFAADADESWDRCVQVPLPPSAHGAVSRVVKGEVRTRLGLAAHQNVLAVLIGGDGAGCEYTLADWQHLAQLIRGFAEDESHEVLLSTSRRTGLETEKSLQKLIPPHCLRQAVWFNHHEERCMADYLAASDAVLVSVDSVSMIAEACSAGFTPWIFRPQHAELPSRVASLISRLESNRMIKMLAGDEFSVRGKECTDSELDRFWQGQIRAVLVDLKVL
jgi:mitochondrial fission protein ELM1